MKPLTPPRLTRNEAEARTALAQRARRARIELGGTACEFTLEPLARDAPLDLDPAGPIIRIDWGGAPFVLRVPAATADHWLRAHLELPELPELDEPLRAAAFEEALHHLLDALEATGSGQARVEAIAEADPPGLVHHFAASLQAGTVRVYATLSTNSFGLMLMGAVALRAPLAPAALDDDGIPMVLCAEVGMTVLSMSQLRGTRPGDAIVVGQSWIGPAGDIWMGQGAWGLRARVDGGRCEITESFHERGVVAMEEEFDEEFEEEGEAEASGSQEPGPEELEADGSGFLGSIPVQLTFDLGRRTMTLGEVRQLQPGQVVDLGRPLSQAVHIRANGALIGSGELVDIDGRLAVSVTSLRATSSAGTAS